MLRIKIVLKMRRQVIVFIRDVFNESNNISKYNQVTGGTLPLVC
jgi:hypothetical protein